MNKKIFVATSYSGESEYDMCKLILSQQMNIDITHFCVENKPILDAFNSMY